MACKFYLRVVCILIYALAYSYTLLLFGKKDEIRGLFIEPQHSDSKFILVELPLSASARWSRGMILA